MRGVEIVLSMVIAVSLIAAGSAQEKEAPNKDSDAIQGTWVASAAETGGKPLRENVGRIQLILKDGMYEISFGKTSDRGTAKLDPSAKPKALDIICTEGPSKGKTVLAIYELHGDTLRICYDLSGKNRPTQFTIGAQIYLVTHERKKR